MLNWINSGSYEYTANMEHTIVGIIGMGDMGKMYARRISDAGWRYSSPRPENIFSCLGFAYVSSTFQLVPRGDIKLRYDDLSAFGSGMTRLSAVFRF